MPPLPVWGLHHSEDCKVEVQVQEQVAEATEEVYMTRRPEARDPHATLAQPRSPPKSFEVRWLSVSPTTSALPVGSMEDEPASTRSKQYQSGALYKPRAMHSKRLSPV